MKEFNSSWYEFHIQDLKQQVDNYIDNYKLQTNKSYTIEMLMKKIWLTKSWYFAMLKSWKIRLSSIKKFMKIKIIVKLNTKQA